MEQLLVFRQRSHDRVFAKTMLKIESKQAEEGGLTSASAAGSRVFNVGWIDDVDTAIG